MSSQGSNPSADELMARLAKLEIEVARLQAKEPYLVQSHPAIEVSDRTNRRDVLRVALGAMAAIGAGAALGPNISHAATGEPASVDAGTTHIGLVRLIQPVRAVNTQLAGNATTTFALTGIGGIPAGATGIVANLTVVNPTSEGYLSAYPAGTSFPGTSNLQYHYDLPTATDLVIVAFGTGSNAGQVAIFNSGDSVQLLIDLFAFIW